MYPPTLSPSLQNIYYGLEIREYGRGDLLRWPCNTLCPQKLVLTSPTSGGRYSTLADSGHEVFLYRFIEKSNGTESAVHMFL
jgi:hypothetical protein